MKAILYEEFQGALNVEDVPMPINTPDSVIIKVMATGICRSDWHGWMGHDPDISLPHVPGHELAGIIEEVGSNIKNWKKGDRATVPFVCGCGHCPECESNNQQVCDNQFQPGFTNWGSFAEYVRIDYADENLVHIPDAFSFEEAASLGCRFITSYRALIHQGNTAEGQWVAVHGCGGVGLSAILIAKAIGANVIAIDIGDEKLAMAKSIGADFVLNGKSDQLVDQIKSLSGRGVHVSLDALGSKETCLNSINGLRKRGKHIQVGLMTGNNAFPSIPMPSVIANELEIIGSHGMQAHEYDSMFRLIQERKINLGSMIGQKVSIEEGAHHLRELNNFKNTGVIIINRFN